MFAAHSVSSSSFLYSTQPIAQAPNWSDVLWDLIQSPTDTFDSTVLSFSADYWGLAEKGYLLLRSCQEWKEKIALMFIATTPTGYKPPVEMNDWWPEDFLSDATELASLIGTTLEIALRSQETYTGQGKIPPMYAPCSPEAIEYAISYLKQIVKQFNEKTEHANSMRGENYFVHLHLDWIGDPNFPIPFRHPKFIAWGFFVESKTTTDQTQPYVIPEAQATTMASFEHEAAITALPSSSASINMPLPGASAVVKKNRHSKSQIQQEWYVDEETLKLTSSLGNEYYPTSAEQRIVEMLICERLCQHEKARKLADTFKKPNEPSTISSFIFGLRNKLGSNVIVTYRGERYAFHESVKIIPKGSQLPEQSQSLLQPKSADTSGSFDVATASIFKAIWQGISPRPWVIYKHNPRQPAPFSYLLAPSGRFYHLSPMQFSAVEYLASHPEGASFDELNTYASVESMDVALRSLFRDLRHEIPFFVQDEINYKLISNVRQALFNVQPAFMGPWKFDALQKKLWTPFEGLIELEPQENEFINRVIYQQNTREPFVDFDAVDRIFGIDKDSSPDRVNSRSKRIHKLKVKTGLEIIGVSLQGYRLRETQRFIVSSRLSGEGASQ